MLTTGSVGRAGIGVRLHRWPSGVVFLEPYVVATGEALGGIRACSLDQAVNEVTTATITLMPVAIDTDAIIDEPQQDAQTGKV